MSDEIEGETWRLVRPVGGKVVEFDALVPQADWFWSSLERQCVPECCGLDAYDFSTVSVAWSCGWGTTEPEGNIWRDSNPGDPRRLAADLREAAAAVRELEETAVSASLFNDILTPESYANLFEDLARKVEPPAV